MEWSTDMQFYHKITICLRKGDGIIDITKKY
jgi:hypothetical protein